MMELLNSKTLSKSTKKQPFPSENNTIAHEQEAQQHTEDQMEANHFEEQEDEVTDDSWEDNTTSPAAETILHSSPFEAAIDCFCREI